jgi:hypothetical protein
MPITCRADAMRYIDGLVAAGLEYHLEDDPADQVCIGTGEPTFTRAEAEVLRRRVRTLYSLGWGDDRCPIGYMLRAIKRRDVRERLAACAATDAVRDRAVSMDYTSWRSKGFPPRSRVDLETRVTDILTREFGIGQVCPSCGGTICCCSLLCGDAMGLKMGANT